MSWAYSQTRRVGSVFVHHPCSSLAFWQDGTDIGDFLKTRVLCPWAFLLMKDRSSQTATSSLQNRNLQWHGGHGWGCAGDGSTSRSTGWSLPARFLPGQAGSVLVSALTSAFCAARTCPSVSDTSHLCLFAGRGPHGPRQDYLPFKRERKRKHPLGSDLGHHIFWHPQWKAHPVQQLRTCGQKRNVQGKSRSSY